MKPFVLLLAAALLSVAGPAFAAAQLPFSTARIQTQQQCFEAVQTFRPSILFQRILIQTGKTTPDMLANNNYATDDEAMLLKLYIPADQACNKFYNQLFRTYAPRIVDIQENVSSQRIDIYRQVIDKELTYGQANHMMEDIGKLASAKVDEIYPPTKSQGGAPSEADAAAMMQPGAAPTTGKAQ